ncbi:MAG: pyridoxamine kinase [Clostridia bacterium]|nr:pyridoxamine kinase [Clostridia bacterium]
MFEIPPKVAAIHDLSCFGRCALTVIIPTLSALGVQTVPLPTALLSTHTGGFENMFFADLSSEMDEISRHFSELDLKFDAIYSGFLGSEAQIERVSGFIDRFADKNAPILVDPVMGDDGALYSTYTKELGEGMRHLVSKADIITPNYTEACFLTDTPYRPTEEMSDSEVAETALCLLEKLGRLGAEKIAVTGFETAEKVITFGRDGDVDFKDERARLAAGYPGTGDIFASVLLGAFLAENDFAAATRKACDFTAKVIEYTMKFPTPHRDGVMLEPCLKLLF